MAEDENRRKRRNTHFINQIRISENDRRYLSSTQPDSWDE